MNEEKPVCKQVTFRITKKDLIEFNNIKKKMCKTTAEILHKELENDEELVRDLINKWGKIPVFGKRSSFLIYINDDEKIKKLAKELAVTKDIIFKVLLCIFLKCREHPDNRWTIERRSVLQKKVEIAEQYFLQLTAWRDSQPRMPEELENFPELKEYFDMDNTLENIFGLEIVADNACFGFEKALNALKKNLQLAKAAGEQYEKNTAC